MGKYVLGLLGSEDGAPASPEDWEIVLGFEQEIRREMVVKMQTGLVLVAALKEAWNDPLVRDRHFVTALQRRSFKSRRVPVDEPPYKKKKGGQKGKGRGKGKSGKQSNVSGCASETPDGKKICYPFNKKGQGCKRAKCIFEHVCGVCFKPNVPMFECWHGSSSSGM